MYKQDILYTGSVQKLDEYKSQPDREAYLRSHTSLPQIDENKKQTFSAKMAPAIHVLKEMFDVSLLTSTMFQVVCLSSFLAMFGAYRSIAIATMCILIFRVYQMMLNADLNLFRLQC